MFEFTFKEEVPKSTKFSDLKTGELFCHSQTPVSIFMKKPHEYAGRQYQSINLESGHSMITQEGAACFILNVKSVATVK